MSFAIQTIDEQHESLIALGYALLTTPTDTPDISRGSFIFLWLLTLAAGVTDNHAHLANVENDLMPDTAEGDMQVRWGDIRGVKQKGATPARKAQALRVTGTALTDVDAGLELTHASGLRFQVTRADIVGPDGFVDVDVAGISTGSATRLNKGEHLSFVNTPVGLSEDAELQLDMDEDGTDVEDPGAYRARQLDRWAAANLGGRDSDYVEWAKQTVGIDAAFCYPTRQGYGSVDVSALHKGSGTARILLEPERADLEAAMNKLRPVSVKAFRVLSVTGQAVDVEVLITTDGDDAHKFDGDDTVPPAVLTWTGASRTVQLAAARPSWIIPGTRLVFKNPTTVDNAGAERIVESLSGGDSFVLEVDDAGDIPAVTAVVYSGGALVAPIRAAIIALFDALGTANPDANPYGTWEGNVDPGALDGACRSVAGVRRVNVSVPAALVEADDPAYPDDATIELLIPGRIIIRAAH